MITLLTDFGLSGPYVAAMKGVILSIHSESKIVDITHQISPQNIDEAAYVISQNYPYFPHGAVHVIVVDPGVGSDRAILGVQTDSAFFIAPDNGVLKYIFHGSEKVEVYQINNTEFFHHPVSQTFHGRDIFAPVAAHLDQGISLSQLGELFSGFDRGRVPKPRILTNEIVGEIIYFDPFGNAVTNIYSSMIPSKKIELQLKDCLIEKINLSYSESNTGDLLAIIGSGNTLEIVQNNGNMKELLALEIGDRVIVKK